MKNFKLAFLSLAILLLSLSTQAQAPKDGILIKMDDYELNLANGTASTKVYFVRSKRLSKVKLEAPVVQAPQGVEVAFEAISEEKDAYRMIVKADAMTADELTLMVDGAGRWRHKIQSAAFALSDDSRLSKN